MENNIFADKSWLPKHYHSLIVEEPMYSGDGNYSIRELEEKCKQFKEYCHQQNVIKHELMKSIDTTSDYLKEIKKELEK